MPLSIEQVRTLEIPKGQFPCIEKIGLEETQLEEHVFSALEGKSPIKQTHPISPAVQKLVFVKGNRLK